MGEHKEAPGTCNRQPQDVAKAEGGCFAFSKLASTSEYSKSEESRKARSQTLSKECYFESRWHQTRSVGGLLTCRGLPSNARCDNILAPHSSCVTFLNDGNGWL